TCRSSLKMVARSAMPQAFAGRCAHMAPGLAESERIDAAFAGAYAYGLLDRRDKYLAVADLAGERRLDDGVDGRIDHGRGQHDLDAYLGQEVDDIFGAPIQLGMAFLAAEALDFSDGQAVHADVGQGFAHLVQLERLDDCRD